MAMGWETVIRGAVGVEGDVAKACSEPFGGHKTLRTTLSCSRASSRFVFLRLIGGESILGVEVPAECCRSENVAVALLGSEEEVCGEVEWIRDEVVSVTISSNPLFLRGDLGAARCSSCYENCAKVRI
jgi:hypothetical protein